MSNVTNGVAEPALGSSLLRALQDHQLLLHTRHLVDNERQLLVTILEFLAEIEVRGLALERGFSGLFEYATGELGYSEGGAWRRINAMRLCRRVAGAREKLMTGALTLTAAAQLQAAYERRERARKKRERKRKQAAARRRREQGGAGVEAVLLAMPQGKDEQAPAVSGHLGQSEPTVGGQEVAGRSPVLLAKDRQDAPAQANHAGEAGCHSSAPRPGVTWATWATSPPEQTPGQPGAAPDPVRAAGASPPPGAASAPDDGARHLPPPASAAREVAAPYALHGEQRELQPLDLEALVEQASGQSSRVVARIIAELEPQGKVARDTLRPLGHGRWTLKCVVDEECHEGLRRLKGLLSHLDPAMSWGALVGRLVQEALRRHDPRLRGSRRCGTSVDATGQAHDGGSAAQQPAVPGVAGREPPPAEGSAPATVSLAASAAAATSAAKSAAPPPTGGVPATASASAPAATSPPEPTSPPSAGPAPGAASASTPAATPAHGPLARERDHRPWSGSSQPEPLTRPEPTCGRCACHSCRGEAVRLVTRRGVLQLSRPGYRAALSFDPAAADRSHPAGRRRRQRAAGQLASPLCCPPPPPAPR